MSQDNVLKKQFEKKDVQRLRNVMSGKAGERTTAGVGFTKSDTFYKEGDVWVEDGREWTIQDGIKQNITKLDKAKSLAMPMFCPKCSKIMNHKMDKTMWSNHQQCYSCVISFETELKHKGLWEDYKNRIINTDIDNFIEDYKLFVKSKLEESNMGFVTEAGDVENWVGNINKDKVLSSLDETIEYLESFKK